MGDEIPTQEFSQEAFDRFHERLREETKTLMGWIRDGSLDTSGGICGLEIEGWLIDNERAPAARNEDFLKATDSELVVAELSKFNFEINCTPQPLGKSTLSHLHAEIDETWRLCREQAKKLDLDVLAIGTIPTVRNEMLNLENISPLKRYYALNEQILRLRNEKSVKLEIAGKDSLTAYHHDVMLEAATTALQIHLQVSPSEAPRFYNAAKIISAPMVAVTANSPYLFEKDLWAETRIPLFEQALRVLSFRDIHGEYIGRVTFGIGYVQHSLLEVFLTNLDSYRVLLPVTFPEDDNHLSHLRLHNGTIWRWNRPLIGFNEQGAPHLRIEHRVTPAGPSMVDTIANVALFLGLVHALAQQEAPPENELPFDTAKKNFYAAAQHGLQAEIEWFGGVQCSVCDLLQDSLLPKAREALERIGLDNQDITYYLDDIIAGRLRTMQTGAQWQRSYIAKHGTDFAALTQQYHSFQCKNTPVHEWEI